MRHRNLVLAGLFGALLYSFNGFALAQDDTPVPMPCNDSDCGPTPVEPPGCDDCAPGPAPDPGTAPGNPIEPDDQQAAPPDNQSSMLNDQSIYNPDGDDAPSQDDDDSGADVPDTYQA